MLKHQKLFITGMGGMVGRALALLAVGQKYIVGGTIHSQLPEELKTLAEQGQLTYYQVDLKNGEAIEKVVQNFNPDVVIHLAARTLGRADSRISSPEIYMENLKIFQNTLSAVKSLPILPKFILGTSGCLVYGSALHNKEYISEIPTKRLSNIDREKEPYRASRLDQEKLLMQEVSLEYIITRPTQITGTGKFPGTVEYYIANEIRDILRGTKKTIEIKNRRGEVDILDARDVASAYLTLVRKGKKGEVYHISSGKVANVEQVAKVLLEITGLDPNQYSVISTDTEKTIYSRFSPAKLKALGWEPRYTLKDALQKYWEYFKYSSSS